MSKKVKEYLQSIDHFILYILFVVIENIQSKVHLSRNFYRYAMKTFFTSKLAIEVIISNDSSCLVVIYIQIRQQMKLAMEKLNKNR